MGGRWRWPCAARWTHHRRGHRPRRDRVRRHVASLMGRAHQGRDIVVPVSTAPSLTWYRLRCVQGRWCSTWAAPRRASARRWIAAAGCAGVAGTPCAAWPGAATPTPSHALPGARFVPARHSAPPAKRGSSLRCWCGGQRAARVDGSRPPGRLTALTSHLPPALLRPDAPGDGRRGGGCGAASWRRAASTGDAPGPHDAAMIAGMFSTNNRPASPPLPSCARTLIAWTRSWPTRTLERELGAIVAARRAYTAGYGERLITRANSLIEG